MTVDKRTGNLCVRAYGGVDKVTGKPYKPSVTLPSDASESEIERAMERMDIKAGLAKRIGRSLTIGGLVSYYLEEVCPAIGHSPTTIESYESNARCYVYSTIGKVEYDEADPSLFSSLYDELAERGGMDGQGLSQPTIKKLHSMLSGCFTHLLSLNVIDHNVIRDLKVPRGESPEAEALRHEDFKRFRDYLIDTPQGVGFDATRDTALFIDLYSGVRRGEIAGFVVGDWHANMRELRVRYAISETSQGLLRSAHRERQRAVRKGEKKKRLTRKGTKTKRTRSVALASDAALRLDAHIRMQAEWLASHGIKQTADTPLFAMDDGSPIRPSAFYDRFIYLRDYLGMSPTVTLKSLRHTQATYLLEAGENLKLIQDRMGHASFNTTVSIYSHVMPGRDAAAADHFGRIAESVTEG